MKRSIVLPSDGRRKGFQIEQRSTVHNGVADLHDAAKADQVFLVDLIVIQHLGVVAEVAKKPVEFPQRSRRAVETPRKRVSRECLRFEDRKAEQVERFS